MAMLNSKTPAATRLVRQSRKVLQEEIWHHSVVFDRTTRGRIYAFLRVLSITVRGIGTKKMFSQAAALSYASLMSLGPIISLAIMISTFVLEKNADPQQATTDMLNRIVTFIAPATTATTGDNAANAGETAKHVNPDLVNLLNSFVASAHSKTVGVFGLLILVFICIQMMVSIENNFNNIWGVRRGRDMVRRVVLYWTVFSLGVLAVFPTFTVSLTQGLSGLVSTLPPPLDLLAAFKWVSLLLEFVLLTLLLAVFYRLIPNTKVRWRPAFVGGAVVAICLILNNNLSFLYVSTVLSKQSLYGSVGIVPILMFGLYVFWAMVLFGGMLTYAMQNANNITADRLWNQVSPRTRRLLNLAVFSQVARAFLRGESGPNSEELANSLRVPVALLNEGLGRMGDLKLVSLVEVPNEDGDIEMRYQPGKPLHQLTLGQFHHDLDIVGNAAGDDNLLASDPLVPDYLQAMTEFESGSAMHQTFAELLGPNATGAPPGVQSQASMPASRKE